MSLETEFWRENSNVQLIQECLQNLQLVFIPLAYIILLPEVKNQLRNYQNELKLFENGIPLNDLTDSSHSILEEYQNSGPKNRENIENPERQIPKEERVPLVVSLKLDMLRKLHQSPTTVV